MKKSAKFKIIIDILMTIALLFLMGYQFWGEFFHEWIGALMFILFIIHHFLNRKWYQGLFRQSTVIKTFQTIIVIAMTIVMLLQMYSGIVMSRYAFSFLSIDANMAMARRLHILGSYWGFVLMSFHLGIHWNMFINMAKSKIGILKKIKKEILLVIGILIALYGVYVFINRDLISYLLLQTEFVFLDYQEPVILFYLDYLAVMGLMIFVAHFMMKGFRKISIKKGD